MTRWIFNVGDPVYTVSEGRLRHGYILATFVFEGLRHFVINDELGHCYYIHTAPRPDKKQAFTPKRNRNEEM